MGTAINSKQTDCKQVTAVDLLYDPPMHFQVCENPVSLLCSETTRNETQRRY